ncbi:MAG TPA: DUF992 domain-containing protein [Pseudolabrys sp.]|nr:DUF992 domain-containing protein [Pseudolabrys sp.]
MKINSAALAALGFGVVVMISGPVLAQAPDRTRVGSLTCDISGGIGMIITSKKSVACVFTPANADAPREVYTGSITKFGIDIGATAGGEMIWSVFAPSNRQFGALAGDYIGGSAEATVGAGLGANVLVGGSNRTVALQPVSVQGQTGLNVAAGVTGLQLRPAR